MGEKYEVPLKNESGDVIGVARIDPDEFVGGVVEVEITDENARKVFQPEMNDFSIYIPPEKRFSGAFIKPAEAITIKKDNKE